MLNKNMLKVKRLALIALLGALLSAFKFMLAFAPNIEVVTLLIIIISVVCGLQIALPATLVFCTIELIPFGGSLYALCYYFHWPLVALATVIAAKWVKSEIGYAILAFFVTAFFGVQTSITYVAVSGGLKQLDTFWYKVGLVYTNGILFYIVHAVGNTLGVLFLFKPAKKVFEQLYFKYMGIANTP